MYLAGDQLKFSPSDLSLFLESEFASWMDRWYAEPARQNLSLQPEEQSPGNHKFGPCKPDDESDETAIFRKKGGDHEKRILERLRSEGKSIVEIGTGDYPQQAKWTAEAMRDGTDVIYQARLELEDLGGFADFLVRCDGESDLGPYHYEVWDTKLAKSPRPYFVIQLCAYTEMLAKQQGRKPRNLVIVLGDGRQCALKVDRYFYYYQALRERFLEYQASFSPDSMPHPGLSSNFGKWSEFAKAILEKSDHLSGVAGIRFDQIKKLEAAGIDTVAGLAKTTKVEIPLLSTELFSRLKKQAKLQIASRKRSTPAFEVVPPDTDRPRRGLALLPPTSAQDVYFDLEGFPLIEGGREYLFGAVHVKGDAPQFVDWWAHDDAEEKAAFEACVDWLYRRWERDPAMHIYHYANYEVHALRRLMGKYGTREEKVDNLLRNQVFVDLYQVVNQGLVVGTPSYSLKDVEKLYLESRSGDVKSAGGSIVAYQRWLDGEEGRSWKNSPTLSEIRDYNRIDCESTWRLTEWLRERQLESGIRYIPHSVSQDPTDSGNDDEVRPSTALAERLKQELEEDRVSEASRRRVQELLAGLLEFHWREAKPVFWRMFDRHEMTEQQLRDDLDCLAGLERTTKSPRTVKRSLVYEYRFDPDQDTKLHEGSACFFAHDLSIGTEIESLDPDKGIVEIKLGPTRDVPPDRLSLIPNEYVSADIIAKSVYRYVDAWSRGKVLSRAVDDLVHRRRPRIQGHSKGPLLEDGADLVSGAIDVVKRMKDTVLCIQGPPGTGKTYTAAAIIVELLASGKRIGVTANSHKAILNILQAVRSAAKKSRRAVRLVKVGGDPEDPLIASGQIEHLSDSSGTVDVLDEGPVVVGGTAWAFCREELQGKLDYLFIDEAGQFSLANVVGVGLAAKNLVLVGDQMQLAQPVLGSHPGDSGKSGLEYLLDGHATIPPDFGVFLDTTWRMHDKICRFISDAVYEGRLRAHPHTSNQRICARKLPQTLRDCGVVYIPVQHQDNSQASWEEVEVIETLAKELLGQPVSDRTGKKSSPISWENMLFVAPYNMQVRRLKQRLGSQARVGSVDRFQGLEADVVIVTMCSSSLDDSPRGADFLLSPNRLNVAVSRAKSLAIVVGSPTIMAARCQTLEQMELVNLYCRLVAYAAAG